ncbi:hypothetical protein BDP27DRAFT_1212985 [Rhodocollybia butyracea]|uniref:DUF6699 domain-containing protein n=1 Tax=Rhodocollybia butyracea TaxID=206335 RepID=A0A9P5PYX3_9AGAR|nr:hypothetical protein BDP27DRAFT_1212985 [Rhodocollybia butyracea]
MQLYHPFLPWDIHIQASSTSGITIADILSQLYYQLQSSIVKTDYNNDVLSSDDKERLDSGYHRRNSDSGGQAGTVRKVDFLGLDFFFQGLARTREGWLIKTIRIPRPLIAS